MRYKVRDVLPHQNDAEGDKCADRDGDKSDSGEPLCPSRQVPIKIQLPVP